MPSTLSDTTIKLVLEASPACQKRLRGIKVDGFITTYVSGRDRWMFLEAECNSFREDHVFIPAEPFAVLMETARKAGRTPFFEKAGSGIEFFGDKPAYKATCPQTRLYEFGDTPLEAAIRLLRVSMTELPLTYAVPFLTKCATCKVLSSSEDIASDIGWFWLPGGDYRCPSCQRNVKP